MRPIFCFWIWFALAAAAEAQSPPGSAFSQAAAGIAGTTGMWKVFTADTLAAGQVSFSASYDRVNRNPGSLAVSTASFAGSFGITRRLELGAAFEASKRVVVRRPDQLSFGQQALGLFGNRTPGSARLPGQLLSGSTRLP